MSMHGQAVGALLRSKEWPTNGYACGASTEDHVDLNPSSFALSSSICPQELWGLVQVRGGGSARAVPPAEMEPFLERLRQLEVQGEMQVRQTGAPGGTCACNHACMW